VERAESEVVYDQGREVVLAVLLRMDEQIRRLEERVARQDERNAAATQLSRPTEDSTSSPPGRYLLLSKLLASAK
jgi:hypothetical protein